MAKLIATWNKMPRTKMKATVYIKLTKWFLLRKWLGVQLIKMGAWAWNSQVEFEFKEKNDSRTV